MKPRVWLWVLGAGLLVLLGWLLWRTSAPPLPPPLVSPSLPMGSPAPSAAAPSVVPPPPVAAAEQPRMRLHGVVQRSGGSEALISAGDAPPAAYRTGEPVGDGWVLANIESDHVMLAKESRQARLDVQSGPSASAAPAAPASAAKPVPLPGFAAGATPPGVNMSPAEASERNQRFLQGQQKRPATGP